ncbi:RecB family exonuclease [soil metagenome]
MNEGLLKLSPSSASDFKSCPQLFKFRTIDRVKEPVSQAAARGSLVHIVLERLFTQEPSSRTPDRAQELLLEAWNDIEPDDETRPSELEEAEEDAWLHACARLLDNYFKLEDPTGLTAEQLEWRVEYELADIHLRGIIDRLEIHEDGSWTLTDYKTGRVPGESREQAAFFGLRFYALMCWRAFGVLPRSIRLVYLSDPAVLTLNPHERMLLAFERQMRALADAIRRALEKDDWRPRASPFCMACPHQQRCPAWATSASLDETPPR